MPRPVPCLPYTRIAIALSCAAILYAGLTGCGSRQTGASHGPRGTLRFECDQPDARLEVDEKHIGPIGMLASQGILVRPGRHRIVVRKPGFFDAHMLVDVTADTVQTIKVQLRPIPQ